MLSAETSRISWKVMTGNAALVGMLEAISAGFCVLDREWKFVWISPRAGQLLGAEAPRMIGETIWARFPEIAGTKVERLLQRARKKSQAAGIDEERAFFDDWGEIQVVPLADGLALLFRKVLDRPTGREHHTTSQSFHQAVMHCLNAEMALLDLRGNITAVNDAWRQFAIHHSAGHSISRLGVGANYLDICRKVKGEDATAAQAVLAGIEGVLSGKQDHFLMEYPARTAHGTDWYLLSVTPWQNKRTGALVSHYNVSELKKVELSFQENQQILSGIIGSALDGMITVDRQQRIKVFNSAAEKMFGYRAGEMLGQPIERLIPHRFRQIHRRHVEKFSRAAASDKPMSIPGHIHGLRANGEEFPIEASISQLDVRGEKLYTVFMRDITNRLKYEEALRESEERYRQLFERAEEAIYIIEAQGSDVGRIVTANKAAAEMLGYTQEELRQLKIFDLNIQDSSAEGIARLERVFQGEWVGGDAMQMRKDGSIFPVEWHAGMLELQGKKYVLAFSRNITDRRRAEAALRESEERFRLTFEDAPIGMLLARPDNQIYKVNKAFCEMLGFTEEELLSRTIVEITHPEDLARDQQLAIRLIQGEIGAYQIEKRYLGKDGRVIWVNLTKKVILNDEGRPIYSLGMVENITERRKTEEALKDQQHFIQTIADATPNIIYLYDLQQERTVYSNRRLIDVLGYRPEEILQHSIDGFLQMIHPEDRAARQQALDRLISSRLGEKVDVEFRMKHKDGHWCWLQTSEIIFNQDELGRPVSILGTAQDVTEKKKLETQFLRAQRMESLGTLAGGIAHDLNNVLAPVLMAIQLLQMKHNDVDSQRWLTIMRGNVERGADMIRQVLLFARGSQGERMPLQLAPLVKEIVKVLRETFPKSIQIFSAVLTDAWQVLGDATQLHQVLINLALNSRDAMPFGGKLSLGVENQRLDENAARMHLGAKAGRYVVITVTDNGEGIAPENLARIFEPFFTTKEQGKGTGLGLSTVQGIIQGHEGFIDVQSELGKGTSFRIFLPAIGEMEHAEVALKKQGFSAGHGELLLVVDDEDPILEITKRTLENYGYQVLTACDGVEAVAIYAERREEIKAVITDLMMPVMDGPSTIRALLKLNPLAKIIACSGVTDDAKVREATKAGARLFLAKPFATEKLLKTVREALKN